MKNKQKLMSPEETLEWLANQHYLQCAEERPIQGWILLMKNLLPHNIESTKRENVKS